VGYEFASRTIREVCESFICAPVIFVDGAGVLRRRQDLRGEWRFMFCKCSDLWNIRPCRSGLRKAEDRGRRVDSRPSSAVTRNAALGGTVDTYQNLSAY
jgi:hypothetical protein